MKISVRVTVNSRKSGVSVEDGGKTLKVRVDAPAFEGKANKRLIEILSEYYHKPKSSFTIRHGQNGRNKIVEIQD